MMDFGLPVLYLTFSFFNFLLSSNPGNGWAAAGILRVLATIRQSEFTDTFQSEQKNLSNWVQEIHTGMYPHLVRHNSTKNVEYTIHS